MNMNDFYTPTVFNSFNPLEESRPLYSSPIVNSVAIGVVAGVTALAKIAADRKVEKIDPSRVEVVNDLPAVVSRLDELQNALTKQQQDLLNTVGQAVAKQNETIKSLDERLTAIEQMIQNQKKGGKK